MGSDSQKTEKNLTDEVIHEKYLFQKVQAENMKARH